MKKTTFKKLLFLVIFIGFAFQNANAQDLFNAIYPIGDKVNIGYKTSVVPSIEKILFEANPIVRLPFYNNIRTRLRSKNPNNNYEPYNSGSTLYLNFRPQFRMYTDESRPVKAPSYRISILGFQYLRRLPEYRSIKDHQFAFSIESGHYSNGQADCAFSKGIEDGSVACDSVCNTITPTSNLSHLLNRDSGNFSTNYTELIANYRIIFQTRKDDEGEDTYIPQSAISLKAGFNRYHNKLLHLADIGGYTASDIKIYGKNRFIGGIEYLLSADRMMGASLFKKLSIDRFSASLNTEYIDNPHPFVAPWRAELTGTFYFKNNMGIFVSGIWGHDNYNYRFVDSGSSFFAGITFDIFPPTRIR